MIKKKIMIAEDDTDILEIMQIILEEAGYEVSTSIYGKSALNMKDKLPDLLLLDNWMDDIDGSAICTKLKSQNITKHIPIIMCSANTNTEKLATECGADDFIAKPFEIKDLLAKVEKHIA